MEIVRGDERGSVKVRERLQFTASIWLLTTLSQLAERSGPLYRVTGKGLALQLPCLERTINYSHFVVPSYVLNTAHFRLCCLDIILEISEV